MKINFKKKIKENSIAIAVSLAGAVAGLLYWKFVGCKTGTCPIKSVWYWSMLYGLILGYLLGDIVGGWTRKKVEKVDDPDKAL